MSTPQRPTDSYCLLVNSCDAYSDCWTPFFTLLARYWQPCDVPIYLNTETKAFAFPCLDIRCPRVGLEANCELAWSERLLRSLAHIPHQIVLYLQEDYFLYDDVDVAMVERLVTLMEQDDISHVNLMRRDQGERSGYQFLNHIPRRAEYRISAQAGLWRTRALRSYLRRHETVWEFEWYGTRRAWRRPDSFYYVNRAYDERRGDFVLPYRPGVVQGRWVRDDVEELFAAHGICVDYSGRGFHDPSNDNWRRKPRVIRATRRLRSIL
jgi:hypothetical protein